MLQGKKTYIGLALTFILGLGAIFGIEPATDTPAWMDAVLMLLTTGFAAYGRLDKERRAPDGDA